jgi:transposase InsO family protein
MLSSGNYQRVIHRFRRVRQWICGNPDPRALIQRHCAVAESFFAALKNERVHRTQYPTRDHAYRDVVRYIEFWYNSKRRHSGLQYRTPQQVHDEYLEQQIAA